MEALLTPEQIAGRLKLTPHTIYVWLREGRLPGIKLGRRWRAKPADLDAYLEAARHAPASAEAQHGEGVDLVAFAASVEEMMRDVPQEEWDRVPPDLCEQLDHYLYGHPTASPTASPCG